MRYVFSKLLNGNFIVIDTSEGIEHEMCLSELKSKSDIVGVSRRGKITPSSLRQMIDKYKLLERVSGQTYTLEFEYEDYAGVFVSSIDYRKGDSFSVLLPDFVTQLSKSCLSFKCDISDIIWSKNLQVIAEMSCMHTDIHSAILPNSVKVIGHHAFAKCEELESVRIPASVVELNGSAFVSCTKLREVVIEEGLTCIPSSCFDGCVSLRVLRLPSTVKELGEYCLRGCTDATVLVKQGTYAHHWCKLNKVKYSFY